MIRFVPTLLLAVLVFTPLPATAQSAAATRFLELTRVAPDLTFPKAAKKLGFFSSLEMAIYKPEGDGKFPAVVLVHTCGGLSDHIRTWTREALKQGYVVFVVDSFGPRGIKTVCFPSPRMNYPRGVKDALDALAHLKKLDFVDPERVAIMGFSWGAILSLWTSSDAIAGLLPESGRFAAAVAFYPACWFGATGQTPEIEFLRPDTGRPTLVLMGELDNETPPADCLPRLQALKDKGAPVEWHLYSQTTHCWDCRERHNQRKTDFRGNQVQYLYSKDTTDDSARRAFEFLARHLKKGS